MPFVKLDVGILDSSLWTFREQRDLFLTSLLMAVPYELMEPAEELKTEGSEKTGYTVPPGWYGIVRASSMGIIGRSRLDHEDIEMKTLMAELKELSEPDPWSRSDAFEGRRMIRINGGFLILNFAKYRELDRTGAERQAKYRSKRNGVTPVTSHNEVTQAEAEAEAEKKEEESLFYSPLNGKESASPPLTPEKKAGKRRPESFEEVKSYVCDQLKLPENDAAALWEHWQGNDFRNNGRAMASWKSVASNWERRGIFFPSLQEKRK